MGKTAFIFPGQGAQYCGMGQDFYEKFPSAREIFDQASQWLSLDMKALCFEKNDRLNLTEDTQAALVTTCLAMEKDARIGTATVYRMVNTLEEIGAISRKNMYKVTCCDDCQLDDMCVVEFEDGTSCHLSAQKWNRVMKAGLEICGYLNNQKIAAVSIRQ